MKIHQDGCTQSRSPNVYQQLACKPYSLLLAGLLITTQLNGCGGSSYSALAASSSSASSSSGSASSSSSSTSSSSSSSALTLSDAFPNLTAFTEPVFAVQAPGDNTRWFVVEKQGVVRVFSNAANVSSASVMLDISTAVQSNSQELGLLGLAFHPSFPSDPRVFVNYTATVNGVLVSRVSAFRTTNGGATIDPTTETILLTVNQPEQNHKGGNLAFGADGDLYIGFGDGGGSGDQHGTIGNAQNLNILLGKILRIDVGAANATSYSIPTDNPYSNNAPCNVAGTGSQACPEIFAYGFRNPWRYSFDSQTGDLWVGDVGQSSWEEVDLVTKGNNYGWRCREGKHPFDMTGCGDVSLYTDPIAEYDHTQGIAITGGYVYRGSLSPAMQGKYIYGDYGSGRIWALTPATGAQALQVTQLIESTYSIASFAQGNDGELYLLDYSTGRLIRMAF